MPRRRNLSVSQQKQNREPDDVDREVVDSQSVTQNNAAKQGVVACVDEEELAEVRNAETDDESEPRERSLSTSSSSDQRNRSLEALFQVTDTELQAISKQGPDGQHTMHIESGNLIETVYVIDSAIQEREELVGETEVVPAEIHIPVVNSPGSADGVESPCHEETESTPQSHVSSCEPQPSTSVEEQEVDTQKWRQFKNIERILQNAGIDTSSKTWLTLTRPGRHICPYCQRACTKPSVLEKHIRAHTGERPYPCLVCGFSFKTKSNLYKHCKSRAHTLKTNVEAKKLQAKGLAEASGNEVEVQTIERSELFEEEKKMEPAQRHVIQEVVKYLEKGKNQRPSEVHTERQRAKLERLKSLQEKSSNNLKKLEDSRSILQRQLSLPVLPLTCVSKGSQFQKIAPKEVDSAKESAGDKVNKHSAILMPGMFYLNERGEVARNISNVQTEAQENPYQLDIRSSAEVNPLLYNRIEIVNLPDPDTDPETSTKALHDLEELSDKFSKAAKDGLQFSTAVKRLPDKRVQVVLQLQQPAKLSGRKLSSNVQNEQMSGSPVVSKSISSVALKERIQRLISANAAIVDTPKVEPPRAKCMKRHMSRQDSESMQHVQTETETAVSRLLMPDVISYPLEKEREVLPLAQRQAIHKQDASTKKQQNKRIVVEKMEYEEEDALIISNDISDEEHTAVDSQHKFGNDNTATGKQNLSTDISGESMTNEFSLSSGKSRLISQISGRGLRAGLELPLTTIYLPVTTSESFVSRLNQSTTLLEPSQTVKGCKTSVIMPPVAVASSSQLSGQGGKTALRNLKSRSLSTVASATAPYIPVITQSTTPSSVLPSTNFTLLSTGHTQVQYAVETQSKTQVQYTLLTSQAPTLCKTETTAQLPFQYTMQTPDAVQTQRTLQNQDQVPAQLTIHTPCQTPQYIVQTPGQIPSQYVIQTPNTPVAQVLLPGSSLPVLLLGGPAVVQQQLFTQPEQETSSQQQIEQKDSQSKHVVIQTPGKSQLQQQDLASKKYVHQYTKGLSSTQTDLKKQLSNFTAEQSSMGLAQSPLLSSSQNDHMKILSSAVSNTVIQQKKKQTSDQQPKEIKIEIKLPPPLRNYSTLEQKNSIPTQSKSRPPLKRQNPVPLVHSPPINVEPKPDSSVFRFSNAVTSERRNEEPVSTASQTIKSVGQTIPFTVSKIHQTAAKQEDVVSGTSVNTIKESLQTKQSLLFCPYCHISFKKRETLDLHLLCYCKNKNQALTSSVQTNYFSKAKIQTEIVAKLFSQCGGEENDNRYSIESPVFPSKKEDTANGRKTLFKSITEYDTPTEKKRKLELPLGRSKSVIMSPRSKAQLYVSSADTRSTTMNTEGSLISPTNPSQYTGQDMTKNCDNKLQSPEFGKKEVWQTKLKGQILRRKLKGKLLNRSPSLGTKKTKIDIFLEKVKLKTKHPFPVLHRNPLKEEKTKIVHSYDDSTKDGLVTRKCVFKRSKSVPALSKNKEECFEDGMFEESLEKDIIEDVGSKEDEMSGDKKGWQLDDISVPVVTADMVMQSAGPIQPIYQQNFRMKSFEGMGTPAKFAPSATLSPRPELMEIEQVRKMFSFESGSLKFVHPADSEHHSLIKSPLKSPAAKLPVAPTSSLSDSGSNNPPAPSQSPTISQKVFNILPPLPLKKSNAHQFSLVSHSYPSLRSRTHLTFCCVDRLQPSYVRAGKKISMYSNWRTAKQNTNPLGLAARTLLSLYNSRYTTNPVWVINSGSDLRFSTITHSSYWKVKHGEKDIESVFSLIPLTSVHVKKDEKFEAGYKTSEESVYIRGRGRGKYVCETCGIRCRKPSMLKKHIRTHTDLRPYKCKHCKFSFKTKGNLQKHMKSKSHYKKCLDLGISPVPTAIDESQIDEEALQAQCYLSKRAKIVDKLKKGKERKNKHERPDKYMTSSEDGEESEEDSDQRMDDCEEIDDIESEAMEVDVSVQEDNRNDEDEKEASGSEDRVIVSKNQETTLAQTQHNLFLQSLGIIAKHQLTGDQVGSQLLLSGIRSPQLPVVSSLGIDLHNLNQLGTKKREPTDGSVPQTASSLSTVYGNFQDGSKDVASVSKEGDVIWGLLNLSDQPHSDDTREVETCTPSTAEAKTDQKGSSDVKTTVAGVRQNITQALGFLPPYLSAVSTLANTLKLESKNGPIIGQIIRNDSAPTKGNTSVKSKQSTAFMPFQFQHPFPGTPAVVMTSAFVPSKTVTTADRTALHASDEATEKTNSQQNVSVAGDARSSSSSELKYVQIGNIKREVDAIQAQIVNIDPEVFRPRTSQENFPSNFTEIPVDCVLQLKKVSEGLYVITSENEIDRTDKFTEQRYCQSLSSSSDLLPGQRSESHVTSEGHSGRFVCSICKASFEEHHQLILHGNVHFLDNSRLKCGSCSQKFRSHSALEKHSRSEHYNDFTIERNAATDGIEPRPYKCVPCDTAFRLKGHLTKHFRSRSHFKNFEALGKLPIGTWEKLEHKVSDIDANTVDEFMARVDLLVGCSSTKQRSWSPREASMEDDEVFIENDASERVRVEVNELPYQFNAIRETDHTPQVFSEDSHKQDVILTEETAVTTADTVKMKPHKCGLCGRGFQTVSELKSHLITHAELRPYVCEFCDAGFTNAQSLKIHLYTHTQDTPYICGMCGMKFPNTSSLSEHCKVSHPPPGHSQPSVLPAASSAIPSGYTQPSTLAETSNAIPAGHTQPRTLPTAPNDLTEQTIATTKVCTEDDSKVVVCIAACEQDFPECNKKIETSENTHSCPELSDITVDRKSGEIMEDSDIFTTDNSDTHTTVTIVTCCEHTVAEPSYFTENTDCSEAAVCLTEQFLNTNVNEVVYPESSEQEQFVINMEAPTSPEHVPLPSQQQLSDVSCSEREQLQATNVHMNLSAMTDIIDTSVSEGFNSVHTHNASLFVPVAEQTIIAMETKEPFNDLETASSYSELVPMETEETAVDIPVTETITD